MDVYPRFRKLDDPIVLQMELHLWYGSSANAKRKKRTVPGARQQPQLLSEAVTCEFRHRVEPFGRLLKAENETYLGIGFVT